MELHLSASRRLDRQRLDEVVVLVRSGEALDPLVAWRGDGEDPGNLDRRKPPAAHASRGIGGVQGADPCHSSGGRGSPLLAGNAISIRSSRTMPSVLKTDETERGF